jgi:tetratricopeptide (TPR) repeat protein
MANDWFRKTTWSEADQADFFARLKRSRGDGMKAQFLRIQAYHLEETQSLELVRVAVTLLDKMLIEFPQASPSELPSAYNQKATCLAALGKNGEAIDCYRLALDAERKTKCRTRAWLDFGRFICERMLFELFDEAVAILDEFKLNGLLFPIDTYEFSGIHAIIAARKRDIAKAKQFAAAALKAAAETKSGLRYHPTIGLVRDKETPFYKSVQAIAQN